MQRVALKTLGCKANHYDSALMADRLKGAYRVVPFGEEADIYIINTCTVTQKADVESRQLIRRAKRQNPRATVVVTGCYSQVYPSEVKKVGGVDLVLENPDKERVLEVLLSRDGRSAARSLTSESGAKAIVSAPLTSFLGQTRAFLKVQDGCNARCSYCVVPLARGASRSLAPDDVLHHLEALREAGFKEAVLTGIHLGAYGLDLKPTTTLDDLLERIGREKPLKRIRLSSIEPHEVTDRLLSTLAGSEVLCPHLHIPLQSGDDEILKDMHRPYSSHYFEKLIERITSKIPHCGLGVDVMVGFPGEDEHRFNRTYRFVEELPVSYLHVFPFSKRPGTTAADLPDQVAAKVKKERARLLRELGQQKREGFYSRFVGSQLAVLIEDKRDRKTGLLKGFSSNYVPVLVDGPDGWKNEEIEVTVAGVKQGRVYGAASGRAARKATG